MDDLVAQLELIKLLMAIDENLYKKCNDYYVGWRLTPFEVESPLI